MGEKYREPVTKCLHCAETKYLTLLCNKALSQDRAHKKREKTPNEAMRQADPFARVYEADTELERLFFRRKQIGRSCTTLVDLYHGTNSTSRIAAIVRLYSDHLRCQCLQLRCDQLKLGCDREITALAGYDYRTPHDTFLYAQLVQCVLNARRLVYRYDMH